MVFCYDCNQLTSGRCPQHSNDISPKVPEMAAEPGYLPYHQHGPDQYANLVALVAELERRLTALQTTVDGLRLDGIKTDQRLDEHAQRQTDVHGLTAGPTADRLARREGGATERSNTTSPPGGIRTTPEPPLDHPEARDTWRTLHSAQEWPSDESLRALLAAMSIFPAIGPTGQGAYKNQVAWYAVDFVHEAIRSWLASLPPSPDLLAAMAKIAEMKETLAWHDSEDHPGHHALDEINRDCGYKDWEYPGQVIRAVKDLKAERDHYRQRYDALRQKLIAKIDTLVRLAESDSDYHCPWPTSKIVANLRALSLLAGSENGGEDGDEK